MGINMKISFTTLATPELTGVEAIRLAGKFGYGGVDLRVSKNKGEVTLDSGTSEINEIKAALKSEGIELSSLLCYNHIGALSPQALISAVDDIRRNLELADRMGAVSIRVFSGKKEKDVSYDAYFNYMLEIFAKASEDVPENRTMLLQNHFGEMNAAACAKIVQAVNRPCFKLFFSTEHCLVMGESYDEVLKEIDGTIGHVFLADIILQEQGYRDVYPGKGEVPLKHIFNFLREKEFNGWISFKWERIWHPELAGYDEALPAFLAYMKEMQRQHASVVAAD